ncbi:hypothetical protein FRC07_007066, partial [Ceratobasidium sp. 392]
RAQYGPHVGGKFIDGAAPSITVFNPATNELITNVASASPTDVENAISAAQETFKSGIWSRAPALHRASVLARLARLLEARVPDLAQIESMQTGRTIREMKIQLARLPEWIDYFAALVRTQQGIVAPTHGPLLNYVTRVPLGVVAQITPFNHPLLIAIKKIAPALAAGNSVIVKPSEARKRGYWDQQLAVEAGVPPSTLQILPGGPKTAQAIVSNPLIRKVDVTAGTAAGRAIGATVGKNLASYTAELGGKAPIVIFGDADLEVAVNGAAFACFVASGQTCVSGTRLIVEDSIYDEFVDAFVKKVKSIEERMGDPLNPKSTIGPLISQASLARTEQFISRLPSHTKILTGGARLASPSPLDSFPRSSGYFFPPTVIAGVKTSDELWQEEVFGPVVALTKFSGGESEAIQLANNCKYGLGAGIWTQDVGRAVRVSAGIEAGLVWVNAHHRNDPSSPWGGMKESGIGRENGVEAFDSYTQSKSTIINTSSVKDMREKDDWFADSEVEKRYG